MQTVIPPELAELIAESEEPRKLSVREQEWAAFIRALEPWQFHKLMIVGEMELHDRFLIDGNLAAIFDEICVSGEENPFKKSKEDSDASPVRA